MHTAPRTRLRPEYVVVVALLLTQSSEQALDWTIHHAMDDPAWVLHFVQIAPPAWARLRTLHALDPRDDADACSARASKLAGTPLEGRLHFRRLVDARPERALARYAAEVDADLLVIEAPGSPIWVAQLVGTVVDRVAREVGCSVAVIRPKARDRNRLLN